MNRFRSVAVITFANTRKAPGSIPGGINSWYVLMIYCILK